MTSREDCGIVPIGLLTNYLHVLKRKKERKLLYVTFKMYLYVLENAVKCLPQAQQQSSIWWKITDDIEEQYTKVRCTVYISTYRLLPFDTDMKFTNLSICVR